MGKQYDVSLVLQFGGFMGEPDESRAYFTSGSPLNYLSFSNPAVDTLWQQEAAQIDAAKRADICRQIESAILSNYELIQYPITASRYVWWPYVKGYVPTTVWIGLDLQTVWLNK